MRDGLAIRGASGPEPQDRQDRFWAKVERSGDCLVWTASTNKGSNGKGGYGKFFLRKVDGRPLLVAAHRYSYELAYGPIPDGAIILHSCDNRACVNPNHLRIGTYTENSHDALSRGRHDGPSGETHPLAKLSDAQVLEIRRRYGAGGVRQRDLATEYGVDPSTISKIITGDSRASTSKS